MASAAAAGIDLLALTDHDTVAGVDEAVAAANEHGIAVIPAVEISAADRDRGDLHVLGYLIDHHDSELGDVLARSRVDRDERAARMAEALRNAGIEIDTAMLDVRRAACLPIGRPHLAMAAIRHPANAARLAAEQCDDVDAFIERYLVPGKPGFRPRQAPSVAKAIELIHGAGGLAVWAHPYWDLDDDGDVDSAIARFAELGLDGVEAFYVTHTPEQTHHAAAAAERHGLLTTGSADFHGPDHPRFCRFGAFATYGLTPNLGAIGATGSTARQRQRR